jgi:hypothetical protein
MRWNGGDRYGLADGKRIINESRKCLLETGLLMEEPWGKTS